MHVYYFKHCEVLEKINKIEQGNGELRGYLVYIKWPGKRLQFSSLSSTSTAHSRDSINIHYVKYSVSAVSHVP